MMFVRYVIAFVAWIVAVFVTLYLLFGAAEDSISAAQAIVWLAVDVALFYIGWRVLDRTGDFDDSDRDHRHSTSLS